jgi:hypothetical protein
MAAQMKHRSLRESQWRRPARPVIERVIRDFERAENAGQKFANVADREKALRAAFNAAYPFVGAFARKETIRRVWLDEIKRVRGIKPTLWSSKKELERVARLLAANEDRYGTPESKQRLLATLSWRPRDVAAKSENAIRIPLGRRE